MLRRVRRRRAISLTSLIDVIFLLLLFFMLTSTFTRFSEVELAAAAAGTGAPSDAAPLFLRLSEEDVRLNGDSVALDGLGEVLADEAGDDAPRTLLVSLGDEVTAQRLTDLLGVLRGVPNVAPQVLGGS